MEWLIQSLNFLVIVFDIAISLLYINSWIRISCTLLKSAKNNEIIPQHSSYLIFFFMGYVVSLLFPFFTLTLSNYHLYFRYDIYSGIIYNTLQYFSLLFLVLFFLKKAYVFTKVDKQANYFLIVLTILESFLTVVFINPTFLDYSFSIYSSYYFGCIMFLTHSFPLIFELFFMTIFCVCFSYIVREIMEKSRLGNKIALQSLVVILFYVLIESIIISNPKIPTIIKYILYLMKQGTSILIVTLINNYFKRWETLK